MPPMKPLHILAILLLPFLATSQTYSPQKTVWQSAGNTVAKPVFSQTVSILAYGADKTGVTSSNAALNRAITALGGKPGVIYFPAGTYFFNTSVSIARDSIILRGAGADSTKLHFNLSGTLDNLISISGGITADTAVVTATAARGTQTISVSSAAKFQTGDWVRLSMNDAAYMASTWAYGSLAQTAQVTAINGNTITLRSPARFTYVLANAPVLRRISPLKAVGIECLAIKRLDSTAGQSSNIVFCSAVNCWINGIESDSANFAHVQIDQSSNIEVTNSFFHGAFGYGGGGQGYGVLLQYGTGECKVESNCFRHLRHSMLLQAGANGNVIAYNYSTQPFWTEPNLPDSSAGEIVLHGNFPHFNLIEGNFIGNIVIDDSHGINGPLNTFLRNRASGYGLFMNFSPATDSQQFIGNELTNTSVGFNFIQGKGHFLYGNNYRGSITSGSASIPDTSLYLPAGTKPPCPDGYGVWPAVSRPGAYNTGTIYAKARYEAGKPASCACVTVSQPPTPTAITVMPASSEWRVIPNPASRHFSIAGAGAEELAVYDLQGCLKMSLQKPGSAPIDVSQLPAGIYTLRIKSKKELVVRKLVKVD